MNTFSKTEAFVSGWHRFKERPFFLIGLFILTTVISSITGFVADKIGNGSESIVINILDFAIQIIISMGMTLVLLRVYDRVETDYTDLIEHIHLFWRYVVMSILVIIVVFLGLVLFIVPGIIAGLALAFTTYLVIDRNLGPVEAMHESMRITQGHRWNLFIFGISVVFFNILGALFLGVGLLITIPVSSLATVHVYRWLLDPPAKPEAEVSTLAKTLSVLLLAGAIVVVVLLAAGIGKNLVSTPSERDAQRKADLIEIKLNAALYADVYGVFPETLSDLVPEYLQEVPTDPTTGEKYTYTNYSEGADYEVCTVLETLEDYDGVYCEFGLSLGSDNALELNGFDTSEELPIEEATNEG